MRRTQATDCRTLAFDPEAIFTALLNAGSYASWWPSELRIRVLKQVPGHVGSQFEVRANGGWFVCEITSLLLDREVRLAYVAGVHRGTGLWTLAAADAGTRVCYEIDLVPHGLLPRLLSSWMDFSKMHSRLMQRLFNGLERHLSAPANR